MKGIPSCLPYPPPPWREGPCRDWGPSQEKHARLLHPFWNFWLLVHRSSKDGHEISRLVWLRSSQPNRVLFRNKRIALQMLVYSSWDLGCVGVHGCTRPLSMEHGRYSLMCVWKTINILMISLKGLYRGSIGK